MRTSLWAWSNAWGNVGLGLLAAAAVGALGGCSNASSTSTSAGGPGVGPTYHKDIEPILKDRCTSCHTQGRIAPFALTAFEQAKGSAEAMARVTADRTMPPWGARETDECTPVAEFKDDVRLTDEQIALFQEWLDAGSPEGDPADAPPVEDVNDDFALPQVDLELAPVAPYATSGDTDEFICFQLDPGNAVDPLYMTGWNIVAGNTKVVHHVLVFADDQAQSDTLVDENGQYPCFGGSGVDEQRLVGAWAPGTPAFLMEDNVGITIPPGGKLVMQLHYHPAGTTAEPDSTVLQLRTTPIKPIYELQFALIGNFDGPIDEGGLLPGTNDATPGTPQFIIPAGAKGHVETMEYRLPDDIPEVPVYGAGTHMHYVGTDMKVSVRHSDGSESCLVQTPEWDFNWQRAYLYDRDIYDLPTVRGGDTFVMRCNYDNSTDNKWVVQALQDQMIPSPIDVTLGEETLDEMCLAVVPFLTLNF